MVEWEFLPPEQRAQVVEALRINAQAAGVDLSGPVTITGEGAELVVPDPNAA